MLLSIADGRPRNIETVTTESLFPTSLQTDSAKIISFIEEYYRYLNTVGLPTHEISAITSARDIDSASNQYLDSIAELIAKNVPQSSSMDKVSLYKLIVKYYNTRGSEESAVSFFKLFLDDIVTIFYPRDRLFDLSSGKIVWQQYEFPPIKLNAPPINGALDIIKVGTSRIITFENPIPNKNIINQNNNVITYGDPLTYDGLIITFDDLKYAGIVNDRYAYTDTGNSTLYTYGLIYTGDEWLLHVKGIFPNNLLNTQDNNIFILEDEQPLEYQGASVPANNYNQIRGVLNLEDTLNSIAENGLAFVTENGLLNASYFFDWTGVGAYWASSDENAENFKLPPIDDGSTWTPGALTTGDAYFSYFSGDIYGDVTLPDQTVYPDGKTNDYAQIGEWPTRTVYHCIDRGGVERDPEHRITWIEKPKESEWRYQNHKGFASDQNIIQDSDYWQAFSYEIISSVSRSEWQDAFTKFVHPAGLKMFNTLLMQFFASNMWNDYIDYWKDITPQTPNAWLEQLWPPWYKELGVARQQHSPRFQPGINFGGIPLEFIIMYSQSDADRENLLRLVLLTYEFIALNAKSERYLVNEDYDSRGIKFADQCPLREGILNRVIGDMTNRTGERFLYKNENLSGEVEVQSADDSYWVTNPTSAVWSNVNNWIDGVLPGGILPVVSNNVFFGLSLIHRNLTNDLSGKTLKNITFTSRASAFILGGNVFTQADSSSIINNSYNDQTVANDIVFANGLNGITFNTARSNITSTGVLSGVNRLIKTGAGTLTLGKPGGIDVANTYSGGTYINAGTIKLGNTRALGIDGTLCNIAAGATLDLNNFQQLRQISFTGDGVITNTISGNQRSLTCGHSSVNAIFTGDIVQPWQTGSISIAKTGANTQTFTGLNNSTGQVRINGGTLELAELIDGVARDILFGSADADATFKYIGSHRVSLLSRRVIVDGTSTNAILDSSGSGSLVIGGAEIAKLVSTDPVPSPKTLVLQGNNMGDNTIGHSTSIIKDGLAVLSIVKAGVGKWILGAQTNTYTGSTSIVSGTLVATKGVATAQFTPSILTVTISTPPAPYSDATFKFFQGATIAPQPYSPIMLIGAPGRTATYDLSNSTLTIPALPLPTYSIGRSASVVNEGDQVTFTLTTTGVSNGTIVPYTITGVTSADINGMPLSSNFTVNNNSATLTLDITFDNITEGVETLTITAAGASSSVTINDTALSLPTFTLGSSASSVNEGDQLTFTLITTNVPNGTLIPYTISPVTSADISGASHNGNFIVNNNRSSLTLDIALDSMTEGVEGLWLNLGSNRPSLRVTINDTSLSPIYSIKRNNAAALVNEGDQVTFTLTTENVSNGTLVPYTITGVTSADISGASLTGNFIVNNSSATLTLNIAADGITEGTEMLYITAGSAITSVLAGVGINDTSLSTGTYSIARSATSVNEGGQVTFTLTTANVLLGTLVPYTITGVTSADIGGASLTGNFNVNSNSTALTLNITSDAITEGVETLTITAAGASSSVTINDTSSSPTYSLTRSASSVNEGGQVTLTLTTTNVTNGTTIPYTITGVTSADIGGASLTGNFTVNSNSAALTLNITSDLLIENAETLTLSAAGISTSVTVNDMSLIRVGTITGSTTATFIVRTSNMWSYTTTWTTSDVTSLTLNGSPVSLSGSRTIREEGNMSCTFVLTYPGGTKTIVHNAGGEFTRIYPFSG